MKILYIATKHNYGFVNQRYSSHHYSLWDTLVNMNNKEHDIIYFPLDEINYKYRLVKMREMLLEVVDKEKPDLCFMFLDRYYFTQELLQKIKRKSVSVSFTFDDHHKFDELSKDLAPYFTWCITTFNPELYKELGQENVIKVIPAYNHFVYKPKDLSRKIDISFVGRVEDHSDRIKYIEKLRENVGIKVWGDAWGEGVLEQEAMIDVFNHTKVNLNFSKIATKKVKLSPLSDAEVEIKVNEKEQVKGRIFEIPGCKGFLLTEYFNGLEDYYKLGEEIETFKTAEEALEKIQYYIKHEEEREKIALAGYKRAIKDHTWEKRFNEIFSTIFA